MAELLGERFELRGVSTWDVLEFSEAVDEDEQSLAALAAVMRLIRAAVKPEDWTRFRDLCRDRRPSIDDLLGFIQEAKADDRPTSLPTDSSAGQPSTPLTSVSPSAIKVMQDEAGRPDRAVAVLRAQRSA